MKITDIKGHVLRIPRAPFKWRRGHPGGGAMREPLLLQVITDTGQEGYCFAIGGAEELALALERHLRPRVLGLPALDREAIWQALWDTGRGILSLPSIQAVFDVALWDLAARAASLPLYQYLGAYRHEVLAYASTFTQESVDAYRALARDCVARGYRAIKLHLFG
jgi:L-alanine-DL-glutamate epimerase-like enolase superfamily enzyme